MDSYKAPIAYSTPVATTDIVNDGRVQDSRLVHDTNPFLPSLVLLVPLLSRMCPSDTYKIWKKGLCCGCFNSYDVMMVSLSRHQRSRGHHTDRVPAVQLVERQLVLCVPRDG